MDSGWDSELGHRMRERSIPWRIYKGNTFLAMDLQKSKIKNTGVIHIYRYVSFAQLLFLRQNKLSKKRRIDSTRFGEKCDKRAIMP